MTIIDISRWQGTMNFDKAKKAGVEGVMLRASYSTGKDSKFDTFSFDAIKAGLPVGAYSFATWHYDKVNGHNVADAKAQAEMEAKALINILKGKGVTGYVALDLELENGQTTSLNKAQMTEIANSYMKTLADAGFKPCIYASVSWFIDRMNVKDISYPLWVAFYHSEGMKGTDFPVGTYGNYMREWKDKIVMWQYSSKGKGADFGASSTYIDLNHLYSEFGGQISKVETSTPKTEVNYHVVVKGDTMTAIAKKYGMTLSALIKLNPQIKDPNIIRVGEKIYIKATVIKTESEPVKASKISVMQSAKSFKEGYAKGKRYTTTKATPMLYGASESKYAVRKNLGKGAKVVWYGYYTDNYLFCMCNGTTGFVKKADLK